MKKVTHRKPHHAPFSLFDDQFFDQFWRTPTVWNLEWENNHFMPSTDVAETDKSFEIACDVPGFDPKEIEVTVESNSIIISGKREEESEKTQKNYHRRERTTGSFYRQINLPPTADLKKIDCRCKNGTLKILVPKAKQSMNEKVKIKVES